MTFLIALLTSFFTLNSKPLDQVPLSQLHNKKILYFNGSFDPVHRGHIAMAEQALEHVDYVILVANHGKTSRKPNRLSVTHRRKMLELATLNHPRILTTSLNSYQLQQYLNQLKVPEYFGIIGMDVYREFEKHAHLDRIFLRGISIRKSEQNSSRNPMLVVNAKTIFLVPRNNDDTLPDKFLNDRPVIKLKAIQQPFSSTEIRNNTTNQQSITHLTPEPVATYIRENQLYKSNKKPLK